ncbi:hypothetical protein NDU88_001993 [Pleurodeles waltl]|uniref:Uncharacterized protein n=1 Tax=Pleurodeles waltl TaxID=8319 RepID=A0AAV7P728_PLEWA|nr:hypothetical protein NDU88_001993 [Pleurodeles waltl]
MPPKGRRGRQACSEKKPTKAQSAEEPTHLLRETTQFVSNPYLARMNWLMAKLTGLTPWMLGTPIGACYSPRALRTTFELHAPSRRSLHVKGYKIFSFTLWSHMFDCVTCRTGELAVPGPGCAARMTTMGSEVVVAVLLLGWPGARPPQSELSHRAPLHVDQFSIMSACRGEGRGFAGALGLKLLASGMSLLRLYEQ